MMKRLLSRPKAAALGCRLHNRRTVPEAWSSWNDEEQRSRFSTKSSASRIPKDGLTLSHFVNPQQQQQQAASQTAIDETTTTSLHHPFVQNHSQDHHQQKLTFHLKTYGCQMNVNDSDIVRSLLLDAGMKETQEEQDAHVLLTNTCAIREGAEAKVWHRLRELRGRFNKHPKSKHNKKVVGVLGCMAERLKHDLFQDGIADLVVGPDAYRDLPNLVSSLISENDVEQAVNVQLSLEETYADVTPVRRNPNDVSAFVSVMRGCNNMCSYCVVPFTRGRERSRPFDSIVAEAQHLFENENVKEIVLLGQNVNSYHDKSEAAVEANPSTDYQTSNGGFTNLFRLRGGGGYYFADLVEAVSDVSPELRVRFTSPHPKDYPPELLSLMAERPNVCNHLHMPAQSGSSTVLERMRRGYSREAYLQLLDDVRRTIPDVAISSDFIAGFCGETPEEHHDTLTLMEQIQYDQAYMFAYSMRGKTHAHRSMTDDVPEEVKGQRLQDIIEVFRTQVQQRNDNMEVGRLRLVLVEGESKRSTPENVSLNGRTDQNKRIVFPVNMETHNNGHCWTEDAISPVLSNTRNSDGTTSNYAADQLLGTLNMEPRVALQPGDYAVVQVTEARGHTLRGQVLWRTTLASFNEMGLANCDELSLKESSTLGALLSNALDLNTEIEQERIDITV